MIVLRCHSASHERIGLVLSLSRWLFFEPSDAMSAVMFFSTGHVFVLAVVQARSTRFWTPTHALAGTPDDWRCAT